MTTALIGISIMAVGFLFLSSLAPSTKAKSNAEFVMPIPKLESGTLITLRVNDRNVFMLRPDAAQRKSITQLDAKVWNAAQDAYVPELDAYVYWGISTRWGCILQEKPAVEYRAVSEDGKKQWLGGYWDPICEVSYDYAGRTIRSQAFSYNGYTAEFPNLAKPKLRIIEDNIVISMF